MKILIVQDTDWIKRGPHQQHHLAELLSLRGHIIRVIDYEILWYSGTKEVISKRKIFNVSKYYVGSNVTVIRPCIIKITYLDMLSLFFFHFIEIHRQIKSFKPDVIIGFGLLNNLLASFLSKINHIPFYYYIIDALHQIIPYKSFKLIAKEIEKINISLSFNVIVINNYLKEYVCKMGCNPGKIKVITAGIDLKRFQNLDRTIIRNMYKINNDEYVLFYMGWLYKFSGISELVQYLIEYPENRIKLMIIGDGDIYNELKKTIDNNKLQNNIILTGKIPYSEINTYIAASDICLLPAKNNAVMEYIVPIKMYEYMASGKPIISSYLPGIIKEFGNNNGIIYANSPKDIINITKILIKSNNIYNIGEKARLYVNNFDWSKIVDQFENEILSGSIMKNVI